MDKLELLRCARCDYILINGPHLDLLDTTICTECGTEGMGIFKSIGCIKMNEINSNALRNCMPFNGEGND